MSQRGKRTLPSMALTLPIWRRVFFLTSVVAPAADGRHMTIGRLADGTIAFVFATLGIEGISVISMRPASRKERSLL